MDGIAEFGSAFFGALYDYRVPVAVGSIVAVVVVLVIARRRGWFAAARRHPGRTGVALVIALALGLPLTWYLASPIFLRSELVEVEPAAAVATASLTPTASPTSTASPTATAVAPSGVPTGTPAPPPPTPAPPTLTPTPQATSFEARTIARGEFYGSDDFHFGRGTASIIETAPGRYRLRLADFSVRNGPDLFVYLSPDPEGYADGSLELGKLKATDGTFGYDLPDGADPADYRSAIIWCKQFSHLFATAPLEGV